MNNDDKVLFHKIVTDESGRKKEFILKTSSLIVYELINGVRYGPYIEPADSALIEKAKEKSSKTRTQLSEEPKCGGMPIDVVVQRALKLRRPVIVTPSVIANLKHVLKQYEGFDWNNAKVERHKDSEVFRIDKSTVLCKTSKGVSLTYRGHLREGRHIRGEYLTVTENSIVELTIRDNINILGRKESSISQIEKIILQYHNPISCEFVELDLEKMTELQDGILFIKNGVTYLDLIELAPLGRKVNSIVFPKSLQEVHGCFSEDITPLLSLKTVDFTSCVGPVLISWNCFRDHPHLREVKLGSNVYFLGEASFLSCTKLETIEGLNNVQVLSKDSLKETPLRDIQLDNVIEYREVLSDNHLNSLKVKEGEGFLDFNQNLINCDTLKNIEIVSKSKDAHIGLRCVSCKSLEVLRIEATTSSVFLILESLPNLREVQLLCPNMELPRTTINDCDDIHIPPTTVKDCNDIEVLEIADDTLFKFFTYYTEEHLKFAKTVRFLDTVWDWDEFRIVTNLKSNVKLHEKETIKDYLMKSMPEFFVLKEDEKSDFNNIEETSLFNLQ